MGTDRSRRWGVTGAYIALVSVVAAGVVLAGIPGLTTAGARPVAPSGATCGEYFCFATPIRHVVEIVMENLPATNVWQGGPFEVYLATHYGYANRSYGTCHPSEPNYFALTMGFTNGECGNGTTAFAQGSRGGVLAGSDLPDLIEARGLTWGAFAESMPSPCYNGTGGNSLYDIGHNPFVRMYDVFLNKTRCDADVRNFTSWNADVAAGTIPNFAFIIPNLLDDDHDSSVAWGDHWLHHFLTPLLNRSWAKNTLFIVTYDEGEPGPAGTVAGYCAGTHGHLCVSGGQVYTAFVSPYTRGAGNYTANVTHYNTLTTIEWLFSLHDCGRYDDPSQWFPPEFAMFNWTPAYRNPSVWP